MGERATHQRFGQLPELCLHCVAAKGQSRSFCLPRKVLNSVNDCKRLRMSNENTFVILRDVACVCTLFIASRSLVASFSKHSIAPFSLSVIDASNSIVSRIK